MTRQPVMDCVVVGAGPAGLAASAALGAGGVEQVFEARVERLASDGDGYALDTGDGTVRAPHRHRGQRRPEPATGASAGPGPAQAGATLAGRLVAVTGERVGFDGSTAADLAAAAVADAVRARS